MHRILTCSAQPVHAAEGGAPGVPEPGPVAATAASAAVAAAGLVNGGLLGQLLHGGRAQSATAEVRSPALPRVERRLAWDLAR